MSSTIPFARREVAPEDDYADLFENAPCGYVSADPSGRISKVNQTLAGWLGLAKEEMVGRRFQDLLKIAGKIYYETHFAPLLRMQGFFNEVALDLIGAEGRRLPVLVNAVERRDTEGNAIFIRITVFNAADRRRYENELLEARRQAEMAGEELRELNQTLEKRVEEAVAERMKAEEALRQSQKMEAIGQLTGGVAHDFNNLLTPILGSLDRLQRRGLGDERDRRLIEGALQSAERAKTLVQRLLAFARCQPLQPTAVDIAELVRGMADLVASTTGPQIRVAVDVEPDLPTALADANQLEMAILNLAVNARDAMPEGGTLRISATSEVVGTEQSAAAAAPGRYVRLSVADTGIGMDEATLARAVEPFFSTKGIGRGTGLGLSMVHGLAAQLGGALIIHSKPGLGTNVELWLPVAAADVPTTAAPAQLAEEGAVDHSCGTVLLVDDEEPVRATAADMLFELGYAVVEASSTDEALRYIGEGLAPDLVVTDHLMPGLTGTELARILQAQRPGLPVLIISGYAELEGVTPDLPRLTKPFRRSDLAASLQALRT